MSTDEVSDPPRVVVIEDDEDVRRLLEEHLRRLGWAVHGAATGEAGLAAVHRVDPHAVVVDIGLPGVSGGAVVASLRADARTAACRVVVTSVLDPDDQARLEPDAILPKPFSRQDVARVMTAAMAGGPAGAAHAAGGRGAR